MGHHTIPQRRSTRIRNIPNYCELENGDSPQWKTLSRTARRRLKVVDSIDLKIKARVDEGEEQKEDQGPEALPDLGKKKTEAVGGNGRRRTLDDYGMRFEIKKTKKKTIRKKFRQLTLIDALSA